LISGKPIAVLLQSISGVSAINPLVAFYDIHEGKREVLFYPGHHTRRHPTFFYLLKIKLFQTLPTIFVNCPIEKRPLS
jgi:hypothetical protein